MLVVTRRLPYLGFCWSRHRRDIGKVVVVVVVVTAAAAVVVVVLVVLVAAAVR